jgi:hypothetical protein
MVLMMARLGSRTACAGSKRHSKFCEISMETHRVESTQIVLLVVGREVGMHEQWPKTLK